MSWRGWGTLWERQEFGYALNTHVKKGGGGCGAVMHHSDGCPGGKHCMNMCEGDE